MPSYAKIDGGISKTNFYDTNKTIMTEFQPNKELTTGKYWEKNLLRTNKYRPLFMISNKELFDFTKKEEVFETQRVSAPTVYNISLKSSSVSKISLGTKQAVNKVQKPIALQKPKPVEKTNASVLLQMNSIYEQAKNPDVEADAKIDAAIKLKNSKTISSYFKAIDLLNDVTKKESYNAYAFYLKGEIYSAQKDSQNAMKNYVEALKINPTSKQCYLGVAKILDSSNKELAQKYYAMAK